MSWTYRTHCAITTTILPPNVPASSPSLPGGSTASLQPNPHASTNGLPSPSLPIGASVPGSVGWNYSLAYPPPEHLAQRPPYQPHLPSLAHLPAPTTFQSQDYNASYPPHGSRKRQRFVQEHYGTEKRLYVPLTYNYSTPAGYGYTTVKTETSEKPHLTATINNSSTIMHPTTSYNSYSTAKPYSSTELGQSNYDYAKANPSQYLKKEQFSPPIDKQSSPNSGSIKGKPSSSPEVDHSLKSHSSSELQTVSTNGNTTADPRKSPEGNVGLCNGIEDLLAKLVASGMIQVPTKVKVKPEVKKEPTETKEAKIDLEDRDSLRLRRPDIISKLYSGVQCSSCSTRFPRQETKVYSRHLDWHFRQNRINRDATKRAHRRRWYYGQKDWLQYEENENEEDREKSWFETSATEKASKNESQKEAPTAVASSREDEYCALCGDHFERFYHQEQEEWQVRNSVRDDIGRNYHPSCLEDRKKRGVLFDTSPESPNSDVEAVERPVEVVEVSDED